MGWQLWGLQLFLTVFHRNMESGCRSTAEDMTMGDVKIQIKNLYKIFGNRPDQALHLVREGASKQGLLDEHQHVLGLSDINIDIPEKRIHVIMGLSGSGKSTLIRHINRLIEPTDGNVLVDGDDVMKMSSTELMHFRRFKASMVFQKFALLPHRTVAQNAAYGLTIQGIGEREAVERSQRWLERVGLGGFEKHFPAQLSGGMQQRVGLARALATDAEILLMDEAFSALDPLIRNDMQGILLDLQRELHKTIVFITHDLDEALRIGDQITILRDGAVIQDGDPQNIIMNPADDYIADFIKDINRGRVIKVSTLMTKAVRATGPKFEETALLEDALTTMSQSKVISGAVVDGKGKVVGKITMKDAISAMARPQRTETGTRYK
jgi:glycine betaine/proline transport system ATP-binding protein